MDSRLFDSPTIDIIDILVFDATIIGSIIDVHLIDSPKIDVW